MTKDELREAIRDALADVLRGQGTAKEPQRVRLEGGSPLPVVLQGRPPVRVDGEVAVTGTVMLANQFGPYDDDNRPLVVQTAANQSAAFGEVLVTQPTIRWHGHFPYGINSEVVTITTSGTSGATGTFVTGGSLRAASGTATTGSCIVQSRIRAKYQPSQGMVARFTAMFTQGVASSTQIAGMGDATNGFFFGYNGTSFGILHRKGGVDTWVPRSQWNVDRMEGSMPEECPEFIPTKLTPFQISMQYLGAGGIAFFIECRHTRRFRLVHLIEYAGTQALPSITNATLPFWMQSLNSGATTSQSVETASAAMLTEGAENYFGPMGSQSNRKTGISTETNILTIRNVANFSTITGTVFTGANAVRVRILSVSMSTTGGAEARLRLRRSTTLGGSPSYTPYDAASSCVDYDTAGTTVSGGRRLWAMVVESGGSRTQDLVSHGLYLEPGETLTLSVEASSNTSPTVIVNWREEW